MNENFANMADVHRILGSLPDGADQMATADGRDKTVAASRARLARMVGRDAAEADDAAWEALAAWFAEAQMRAIIDGAMLVVVRRAGSRAMPRSSAPGSERAWCGEIARRLGRAFIAFETLARRRAAGARRRVALRAGGRARAARVAAQTPLEQAVPIG